VVDTLLFLFPYPIEKMFVTGKKRDSLLYHIVVQLVAAEGAMAIGIMNRDSGTVEERLEVASAEEKRVIINLTDATVYQGRKETRIIGDDWEPTLRKRGFDQIVDHFLNALESGITDEAPSSDFLTTHSICEQIVREIGE
jgi:virulence factor